ncbi:hypothetical protein [Bosea psychrotolerans]|uniref:hypothetical protein n=1 Tax=Bosea psychrotolerans TaxID=1871628 RepID=UPI000CDA85B4|nr:hypothetical protein [Bosea psychrotolerans]
MTNSIATKIIRSIPADQATEPGNPAIAHDMDPSQPADAPGNVTRKRQQLKARAVAGRHIDEALSTMPVSEEAKASRKAKLIELPAGTPVKRRPA